METYYLLFLLLLLPFFWFLKPKRRVKSKEQKRHELIISFEDRMEKELSNIDDKDIYLQKKIALLKSFAKELEFSIFFDKEDIKELLTNLSQKDFSPKSK